MKKFFESIQKLISSLAARMAGKKTPPPSVCEFCGEKGHNTDDCPNAAKFKLFHVDRGE